MNTKRVWNGVAAVLLSFSGMAYAEQQEAVLGAGCFWCVEAVYERLPGVTEVISGYAGGMQKNPTYKEVSRGKSDHVEVVKVVFDPEQITYAELLDMFWKIHDATDGSGVWPDFGPQYRSILLYNSDEQLAQIRKAIAAENVKSNKPIATEVKALDIFYPAEDYHQDYVRLNPTDRYVRNIALPKLKKAGLKP
ncbi:MAG: peptide-methionine (S)-S-oxide reductase MsrA [Verrucomicrobiota bacterium]